MMMRLCSLVRLAVALLASVGPGDHLLIVDSAYAPARTFCDTTLKHLGVEVTYYDPLIAKLVVEIGQVIRYNTENNNKQRPPHSAAFMASP